MAKIKCPACGNPIEYGTQYCPWCGTSVKYSVSGSGESTPTPDSREPEEESRTKRRSREKNEQNNDEGGWKPIHFGILSVLLLAIAALVIFHPGPGDADDMRMPDYDRVVEKQKSRDVKREKKLEAERQEARRIQDEIRRAQEEAEARRLAEEAAAAAAAAEAEQDELIDEEALDERIEEILNMSF